MYHLPEMLNQHNVLCHCDATSRKRVLQRFSELLADEALSEDTIFDGLMARERLGSTALGQGIAIPHCRVPTQAMKVALATLAEPIDYEAGDGRPVDLLFVLVVPEDESQAHLDALAHLAGIFSEEKNTDLLRTAESVTRLMQCMQNLLEEDAPGSVAG